jgi:UDP-N-acetylmuramyl pentapeptide phosphotransferase/UDP-N-acetylglucosamine-1-phosphate transferase
VKIAAFAVFAFVFIVAADWAAGTYWALPLATLAVALIFGADRLTVWRNRPPSSVSFDRKRVGE